MDAPLVIKTIFLLGTGLAIIQVAPGTGVVDDTARSLSQMGAMGILSVAVVVLWRKLQEKDKIIMDAFKTMGDVLATNKVTVEKMSDTLDDIKKAVREFNTVRNFVTKHNDKEV
jgi:hypothetical protein